MAATETSKTLAMRKNGWQARPSQASLTTPRQKLAPAAKALSPRRRPDQLRQAARGPQDGARGQGAGDGNEGGERRQTPGSFLCLHGAPWSNRTQKWIDGIKARREAKAEKERYAKLAEKMHQKRVERIKRREKRNKLLNS